MGKLTKLVITELFTSKSFQKRLARLLGHPITLLAVATILATFVGVWLTNYYQERAWVREKQFEAFRQGYAEALKLVDELSEVMSRRFFGLNRVVWAAKGTGTGDLNEVWDEYYQSVIEWNSQLLTYKGRLERLVGSGLAPAFGSWDPVALNTPSGGVRSVHGYFMEAHERARQLVDCVRESCGGETKQAAVQRAEAALNELGVAMEAFIQACTDRIYDQAGTS